MRTQSIRINPTELQKGIVLDRQNYKCAKCGKKFGRYIHPQYHHVTGVEHHGKTTTRNLRALCPDCHDHITRIRTAQRVDKMRSISKNKSRQKVLRKRSGRYYNTEGWLEYLGQAPP